MTDSTSAPIGPPRKRLALLKIAIVTSIVLAGLMTIAAVLVVIKRDDILNQYVKPLLEHGVATSQDGRMLTLSDLHYEIWQSCVACDSGHVSVRDSATKVLYDLHIKGIRYSFWGNHMECNSVSYTASDSSSLCTIDTVYVDGIAPRRLLAGGDIAALILSQMRLTLCGVAVKQPQIHTSLECAKMWLSPADSQLSAERLTESDSSRECSMAAMSLHGIDWTRLFGSDPIISTVCAGSVLDANDIVILYPGSQYEFRSSRIHSSFPDSTLSADTVSIQPVNGDDAFFADSKYRKTRIRFDAARCSMEGADMCGILEASSYHGRLVKIRDATIDILCNKNKPYNNHEAAPRMPDEILAAQTSSVRFDSVHLLNGTIVYQERFVGKEKPAILVIDSVYATVNGFGNNRTPADTARVALRARLQGYAVRALLDVPLAGAGLSAHCSGAMKQMELPCLNTWLEVEDDMSVKTGKLHEATFEMDIKRGKATGNIRAVYKDLFIALVNHKTKSDGGIFNRIGSFIANAFKLRTNNIPDDKGKVKLGMIKYTHQRDEPFFQFIWFSLRSGLKDLIGF